VAITENKEALIAAGWIYDSDGVCPGCGEAIELWIAPRGNKVPMSVVAVRKTGSLFSLQKQLMRRSHAPYCPEHDMFRNK